MTPIDIGVTPNYFAMPYGRRRDGIDLNDVGYAGVTTYLILGACTNWSIALPLVIGAFVSVPFCAWTVKRMQIKNFTAIVGTATVILGLFTLYRVFFR